jgi:hypothetical protein
MIGALDEWAQKGWTYGRDTHYRLHKIPLLIGGCSQKLRDSYLAMSSHKYSPY